MVPQMKKTQNSYKVDHAAKTIRISKDFARKASTIGSKEYNELKQLLSDFPTYMIEQRKNETNSKKVTYVNLTYKKMEDYIMTRTGNDSSTLQQYDSVLRLSKAQPGSYAYVKKWFLTTFPDYRDFCPENGEIATVLSLNVAN